MDEVERRGYMFDPHTILEVGEVVTRMVLSGSLNPDVPRIDREFHQRVSKINSIARLSNQVFASDLEAREKFKLGYDPKSKRISIRNGDKRLILQQVSNRDPESLMKVIDLMKRENPDHVFLSASPFGIEGLTYTDSDQIDSAMFNRFQGRKNFKVG